MSTKKLPPRDSKGRFLKVCKRESLTNFHDFQREATPRPAIITQGISWKSLWCSFRGLFDVNISGIRGRWIPGGDL